MPGSRTMEVRGRFGREQTYFQDGSEGEEEEV